MKTLLALLLMLFGLVLVSFGQAETTIQSNINAIKSKSKFMIPGTENQDDYFRRLGNLTLLTSLSNDKRLKRTVRPGEIDFLVDWELEKGNNLRLTAYSYNTKKQKVVYWSETKTMEKARNMLPVVQENIKVLVQAFLKAKYEK